MESGFGKSLFGYKKEDVQRSISQLETESQQRIKALEEELESVKNQLRTSESARTSLQQKLEEANKKESAIVDLLLSAREKAVQIEEEARQQAEQKLKDIDQEYVQKQREMDQMRQKYSSFQQDFKGLLGRYTGMLGHLPELVFRDEEKALPAGRTESSGIMAQLPPPAAGEWQMPAGQTDLLKKPEPVVEAPGDRDFGSDAVIAPGGETVLTEGADEVSEFRKALSSLNKLSYESTVEEPWAAVQDKAATPAAAAVVTGSALDLTPDLTQDLTLEPTPTRAPEEPAIPEATATLAEEPPLSVPGPQEPLFDPQYKPFTPFARKNDLPNELVLEKAPLPSRLESSAPLETPVEIPNEIPKEIPFQAPPQTAEYKVMPDIATEPRPSLPDSVMEASEESLPFRAEEPAPIRTGPAGDSGSGLPYKPWDNGDSPAPVSSPAGSGMKDAAQPFAEGASLKELLERHRLEMQRRNQGGADQQDGTLHVEMSEEDKKFWS